MATRDLIRAAKAFAGSDGPWPLVSLTRKAMEFRLRGSITLDDYSRAHREIAEDIARELAAALALRDHVETESYRRRFERSFAALCGRKYAVAFNSGSSALELSLKAMGIGPGDEVITVANTYVATALVIANAGARPVFVDVEEGTANLDPRRLEAAIGPRTRAILPVYLCGQMADMPAIEAIARRHGLRVLADACQAYGASLHGKGSAYFGDVACYSFSAAKLLGGLGDGGMAVTDDRALAKALRDMRDPESGSPRIAESKRTPAFLDPMQIALLSAKLPHVPGWVDARRRIAARFRESLDGLGLVLPGVGQGAVHTYYHFAVRHERRDALRSHLHRRGIRTGIHYTPLLHRMPCFAYLGYAPGDLPVSERIEATTLSLPISPFLTEAEIGKILCGVREFFR